MSRVYIRAWSQRPWLTTHNADLHPQPAPPRGGQDPHCSHTIHIDSAVAQGPSKLSQGPGGRLLGAKGQGWTSVDMVHSSLLTTAWEFWKFGFSSVEVDDMFLIHGKRGVFPLVRLIASPREGR